MHELAVVIVALVLVARLIGVNTLMTNVIPVVAILSAQFYLRAFVRQGVCSKLGTLNPLTEHEAQLLELPAMSPARGGDHTAARRRRLA